MYESKLTNIEVLLELVKQGIVSISDYIKAMDNPNNWEIHKRGGKVKVHIIN